MPSRRAEFAEMWFSVESEIRAAEPQHAPANSATARGPNPLSEAAPASPGPSKPSYGTAEVGDAHITR